MSDSGLAALPLPLPALSLSLLQMCLDSDTARPVSLCALHPDLSEHDLALLLLLRCSFAEENIFEILQEISNRLYSLDEIRKT